MSPNDTPPITPERWLGNVLAVANEIADKGNQVRRWLAPDAQAWECPAELINSLDDAVFDGFIDRYVSTFSAEQRTAALGFRDEMNAYCRVTERHLDPAEVLADPRWEAVRQKAAAFVLAFTGKWPPVFFLPTESN